MLRCFTRSPDSPLCVFSSSRRRERGGAGVQLLFRWAGGFLNITLVCRVLYLLWCTAAERLRFVLCSITKCVYRSRPSHSETKEMLPHTWNSQNKNDENSPFLSVRWRATCRANQLPKGHLRTLPERADGGRRVKVKEFPRMIRELSHRHLQHEVWFEWTEQLWPACGRETLVSPQSWRRTLGERTGTVPGGITESHCHFAQLSASPQTHREESCTLGDTYWQTQVCKCVCRGGNCSSGVHLERVTMGVKFSGTVDHTHWETCVELHTVQAGSCCCCCCRRHLSTFVTEFLNLKKSKQKKQNTKSYDSFCFTTKHWGGGRCKVVA